LIGNPALSLQTPRGGKKVSVPTIADLDVIGSADTPQSFRLCVIGWFLNYSTDAALGLQKPQAST
jgi:hypothetical protein